MKKNIFITIIMMVIALTLTVGSALSVELWVDFSGRAKLYDESGATEVIDIFEAYWIEFWLTEWYDHSDTGGNTGLPTDSVKFQFRENDEPEFESFMNGYLSKFFEPYYTGNNLFQLNTEGLTFTADAYDDGIILSKAISGDDAFLDMYLLGWVNGGTSVEYQITLNWDIDYNCGNENVVMCGPWALEFYTNFDSTVTAPMPEPPSPEPIPEPGTILLLGTGLLGIGIAVVRRKR